MAQPHSEIHVNIIKDLLELIQNNMDLLCSLLLSHAAVRYIRNNTLLPLTVK